MELQLLFILFSAVIPEISSLTAEDLIPKPYTFGYEVHDKDGDQWRSEISDGLGKVHGSYGYIDNYGQHREVKYIADELGFRAAIKTNEPGMDMPNPADVLMIADPPSDYDASIYGVENIIPDGRTPSGRVPVRSFPYGRVPSESNNVEKSEKPKKFYKYQKFAEESTPPIYVVNGHLQSPWFPMEVAAVA
ncbi:uncharacterized protein [Parasteatoda tepidariorum]|uniref:uncharacterized protein n=1 Tax=Parasteatoda tepidariorum TaxID=114398 RepID=UPI00077FBD2D|nr:uncharacterized protein LOC107454161 [Parasteatoda tepidariorum]